jgi:hypothetical protein
MRSRVDGRLNAICVSLEELVLCLSCVRTVSFPTTRGRERKASSRSIESWGYRPGACAPGIIHSILSIIDELAAGGEGG